MYALLPYFGILLGVGAVLYVVVKNIPTSGDEELIGLYRALSLKRYLSHKTAERIDKYLAALFEKMLRKARVILLKAERFVSVRLRGLRGEGHIKTPFYKEQGTESEEKE